MLHFTTLNIGLDIHKGGIVAADATASISPSVIRNKITLAGGVQIRS
jgi:hypothetical protein